jgi:hypothetical protein
MADDRSLFVRNLLGNLRLSGIIIVVGLVGVVIYALVADAEIPWGIVVFLSIGMLLSSLLNAWLDVKRSEHRGADE